MADHEEIERTIRSLLDDYAVKGDSPRSINAGLCEDFACDVQSILGAKGISVGVVYTEEYGPVEHLGGHSWICCNGRHYDAEIPRGVLSVTELPFFERAIALQLNSDPVLDNGPDF